MAGPETNAKKTTADEQGSTTKKIVTVRIFFQRFAGTHAEDGERGIAGIEYTLLVNGEETEKKKTGANGAITFVFPTEAKVQLKIFDTIYDLERHGALEDKGQLAGIQRRLQALGYEPGASIDGKDSRDFDLALSMFAADQKQLPMGLATMTVDPPRDGYGAYANTRSGINKAGEPAFRDMIVAEFGKSK